MSDVAKIFATHRNYVYVTTIKDFFVAIVENGRKKRRETSLATMCTSKKAIALIQCTM
jgi:hypothetical protein